jgi:hypothetical protein
VKKDDSVEIQFAQRSTFDRWTNSTNFRVTIAANYRGPVNLKPAVTLARRICRSGVFDFNTYFHTIDLS